MTDQPQRTLYKWDEMLGVVRQDSGTSVQQLITTSTKAFRTKCGKLLVEALNASDRPVATKTKRQIKRSYLAADICLSEAVTALMFDCDMDRGAALRYLIDGGRACKMTKCK